MAKYMALIGQPPGDAGDGVKKFSRTLYDQIWAPIYDEHIAYRAVHIRAEGDFEQFAFEALHGVRQWIGRAAAIHYLTKETPRSTSFRRSHESKRPSFSYAPFPGREQGIPWAARESRSVAKLTGAELREGSQATKSRLLADIARPFDILHVATHGLKMESHPGSACIALHRPKTTTHPQSSFDPLQSSDLDSLHLDGRLVVLSACAPDPAAAQALSTSLIQRGVGEVISSRFAALDDVAAYTFMCRFYEELESGANSAVALLKARSVMIDGSYQAYSHPYFWAAFRSFI